MDAGQEDIALANRPRDYAGLLWIFAASMLGFSMFCATSAIALSDPTLPTPIVIQARDIPNLAFSNLNTAAAQTAQAFAQLVATGTPTSTFTPSPTWTSSPTLTNTATRAPINPTKTATRKSEPQPTIILPTATRKPTNIPPTNTAVVIVGSTGTAISTEPPTETPVPEPTEPPPPPTDTQEPPPPTDTPPAITTP
ncbi:MAG TPA: hypothetical protein PLA27_11805 [Anaerolineales bacterium]|nr:hypothetical protein [Anaerolineales bacterium]HQX17100.1 hypothetical protein [Anaerolineales bacterium]